MSIRFRVNGAAAEADVADRTTLADCLRHSLKLTGTHVACEHGVCGACTVIVNGEAVRACLMLARQAEGAEITTVEGLGGEGDELSPLQAAFKKHHALQCGFCTPGMLTTLHALLSQEPDADEAADQGCACPAISVAARATSRSSRRRLRRESITRHPGGGSHENRKYLHWWACRQGGRLSVF